MERHQRDHLVVQKHRKQTEANIYCICYQRFLSCKWMKKDGLFNVTMGAYDEAEVCELVGIFSLDKISVKYEKNSIGLYHDNGSSVFKNST